MGQHMNVLGIDPSTKSGVVRLHGQDTYTSIINNSTKKGIQRVDWISQQIEEYLDNCGPLDVAVIEGYAYANQHTLSILVEIGVTLRLSLHRRKIPCYICPPSVLKKVACGVGNAKKPQIAKAVEEKWGFSSPSDDVIDAFVLAKIGQMLANGEKVHGVELML
jgi:crossover junction endodeoxyribonuclease RuvC